MTDTRQMIQFLNDTSMTLENLVTRLASVRYDLFGTRNDPNKDTPVPPATPVNVYDLSLSGGVETLAGAINVAMNRFMVEVDFLQERVNHKEVAKPAGERNRI